MNKVVSIEIAGQVFWIEEEAYDALRNYLKKIKTQLAEDECADEIFQDIELRIAELLFALNSDKQKAIVVHQLDDVLAQVGFIDDEEKIQEVELPRKSFRDPRNKILGGVCAGLAVRWGVPAFIIRLAFLGLTALFGIGIVLYLIFWISLDNSSDRVSTLEAHGKVKTARQIATFEAPKDSTLVQLQRILFLPFTIIGTLISVIGSHFANRKQGYLSIAKNVFAGFLIFIAIMIGVGTAEFYVSHLFSRPVTTILCLSVIYLVILLLAIYFREFYLSSSLRKVDKRLKVAAILPIAIIVMATSYMTKQQSEDVHELVEKQFAIEQAHLVIDIDKAFPEDSFYGNVKFKVRTNQSTTRLNLLLDYSSSGSDERQALKNAHAIDFLYTFENNQLKMNRYWTLKDGHYNRGQSIYVTIEVPQNIKLVSSRKLGIMKSDAGYEYWASYSPQGTLEYFSSGAYLHELDKEYANRVSPNELRVLKDRFCGEYFITESWSCDYNIRQPIEANPRFDRAFEKDIAAIDSLREYMLPDRSLFVTNLNEMLELVSSISIEYPVKNEFHRYLEHLQKVKSNPALVSLVKSG